MKLENEQDKLKKQKTKQEIRAALQKALEEKIEHIHQEYREEQDLNMKLVQRALQDLQEEADKKKQKRVRCLFSAYCVLAEVACSAFSLTGASCMQNEPYCATLQCGPRTGSISSIWEDVRNS